MSTRAELEDQAHFALMDVNKHWLQGLTAEQAGDLTGSHSAFEDIITAARAGKAALEALESMGELRRGRGHAA